MTETQCWEKAVVGKYAALLNGYAFASSEFTESGGMPLIRIRDLRSQTTEINYRGKFDSKYVVRHGDLLIGMDGDFDTVKWKGGDALLNQRVCKLETHDPGSLVQDYLFYRIIDEVIRINRVTAATTVKHLSSSDVLGIEIELPSPPEQSKIAEILSTLDRAIEQTEALIAKQQRIKTGLMQDLLTRGIDEQGNLRSEQTHKFKDSPLGRIPVEWDVKRLDAVAKVKYGISDAIDVTNRSGIPTVTLPCVAPNGNLDLSPTKLVFTPRKAVKDRDLLKKGDLLFNWRNGSQHHLGKTAYFDGVARFTHVGFLLRIRTQPKLADSRFLWYLINYIKAKGYFLNAKIQVNNTFNSNELNAVELAFPQIDEQHLIRDRLNSLENAKASTTVQLEKLRVLKTAVMQDLLTGNKSVTPLLETADAI